MRTLAVVASFAALLAFPVATRAQGAPVYHGNLKVLPANGLFQKSTMNTSGIATLRVRNWVLNLAMGSNGIAPDKEPILIAVGDTEKLVIPAGQVKASKNGKRFAYHNPSTTRGVQMLQIRRLKDDGDGTPRYRLTFTVKIDLSFILSDGKSSVPVKHKGAPPDLFAEGRGAVVEGSWTRDGYFKASLILAKHSEEYKAPHDGAGYRDLIKSLQKTGS